VLPDLSSQLFMGVNGRALLMSGIAVSVLGSRSPRAVHAAQGAAGAQGDARISELIFETASST